MSLSSYRNEPPMYFLHLHIAGRAECMWYSETKDKFGMHPDVLFAHACDKEDGELNVSKLQIIGIPVIEAILVPCDSRYAVCTKHCLTSRLNCVIDPYKRIPGRS